MGLWSKLNNLLFKEKKQEERSFHTKNSKTYITVYLLIDALIPS